MIKYLMRATVVAALFALPAVAQTQDHHEGILKVCKVAGAGVQVGTPFTFTTSPGWTFQVPAGAPPGGNCWIGGVYPVGSSVTITEAAMAGVAVSNITAVPGLNSSNLATGTANVTIGAGTTEVTYTNKKTGYLEICKFSPKEGNYSFTLNPGGQTVVVPAMSCSPAIQVTAGQVAITEAGGGLNFCFQWQGSWVACPVNGQTATVNVSGGGITSQTVVLIFNNLTAGANGVAKAPSPDNGELDRMLKNMGAPPLSR